MGDLEMPGAQHTFELVRLNLDLLAFGDLIDGKALSFNGRSPVSKLPEWRRNDSPSTSSPWSGATAMQKSRGEVSGVKTRNGQLTIVRA